MGRISKELKELKEREKPYPVLDRDYYVIRVAKGGTAPARWVYTANHRGSIVDVTVTRVLAELADGVRAVQPERLCLFSGAWFMYAGPKPDKRWGPVCP